MLKKYLKTKLALSELNNGEILKITATNPTSWEDLASYARIRSNKLIHAEKKGWEVCL